MSRPQTMMAISAHHNRIGFVFLIGRQPMDWQLAHHAATSPDLARAKVLAWLRFYCPDRVIIEDISGTNRKGLKAQKLILAIKEAALETGLPLIEQQRQQPFANKYEQIERLCEEFPQVKIIKPKKREVFDTEPPQTTLFEALAMAQDYLDKQRQAKAHPPDNLPV